MQGLLLDNVLTRGGVRRRWYPNVAAVELIHILVGVLSAESGKLPGT